MFTTLTRWLLACVLVLPLAANAARDQHSYSNPDQVLVTHLTLDLTADFDAQRLRGSVVLDFKRVAPEAAELVLDTRDLTIEAVQQRVAGIWKNAAFEVGKSSPDFGASLTVQLATEADQVKVVYESDPGASGLQWLEPAQTAGKKHPFLYSQAQAIHARSFVPLQDTPAVRITYDATLRVPKGLRAVMSASNDPTAPKDGVFNFNMPQPIPSYLLALAVGDLDFQPMGERTGVYAEPAILERAAWEFADTESMLEEVEKLYGAYTWDRYDLLILPPSFPWGGMENPRLSFITPTVIAGDRSLVSLIAHELAHSWSGNTVTNATWPDIWLNEGFTTYLTYRIMELVYGERRADMERVLGYQDLEADIASMPAPDTRLLPDLTGRDPDAAFSDVPYEKGALFVTEMEHRVGREAFDEFLRNYFQDFAFQSLTTDQFLAYADQHLVKPSGGKITMKRLRQWIFEPGIPEGAPVPSSDAFDRVAAEAKAWLAGEKSAEALNTESWTVDQWRFFLNNLPRGLSEQQLAELDAAFGLTASSNAEIAHSWLLIAIRHSYAPAWPRVDSYLVEIGRRKLIVPLYQALLESESGRQRATAIYERAAPGYQVVARNTVEALFDN